MKKVIYYTLENNDGHVYCGASTLRVAKKMYQEFSNEGVCYKRIVGSNYKKIAFIW